MSTTDITGRLLRLISKTDPLEAVEKKPPVQKFLQTGARIRNFSTRLKDPKPSDKIVYYQASCDLFHPGVIERLKLAKQQGDYLYVGLWSDEMVRYYRGENYPLMCLQERLLMILACKYVDDVVIEAPFIITEDLIKSLGIHKVVNILSDEDSVRSEYKSIDPFAVAKAQDIYTELPKNSDELTVEKIAMRVAKNKEALTLKFERKSKSENQYYQTKKSGVAEH